MRLLAIASAAGLLLTVTIAACAKAASAVLLAVLLVVALFATLYRDELFCRRCEVRRVFDGAWTCDDCTRELRALRLSEGEG